MGMKKRALLGTTAAAVLVAGGAIGGYALTQGEPAPEPTVQAATAEPTPDVTETPTPTPAPTATSGPIEVTPTPQPTVGAPIYETPEEEFIARASDQLTDWGYDVPAEDAILSAGHYLCEEVAAGALPHDATAFGDVGKLVYTGIYAAAEDTLC